jgi:hypothetical protein
VHSAQRRRYNGEKFRLAQSPGGRRRSWLLIESGVLLRRFLRLGIKRIPVGPASDRGQESACYAAGSRINLP